MSNLTVRDHEYLIFTDPELLRRVTRHVSNGGSMIDLAALLRVEYCDLIAWIRIDKTRTSEYEQALIDRKEWAKESILRELRAIGSFDIRSLLSDDGSVLPVSQWPADAAKAVAAIEVYEEFAGQGNSREKIGETKRLKMVDKIRALEIQAKHLSMLTEKHEITGKVTLDQLILATQKKDGES